MLAFLDPMTRTHLTNFQGKDTKPAALKQEILKFVSNAVMDANAMQIGSLGDEGGAGVSHGDAGAYPESEHSTEEWSYYEEVNAIGNSGGYWQPKGKGKGKRRAKVKEKVKEKDT